MQRIRWYVSPFLIVMIVAAVLSGCALDCVIYFATIVLHELAHAEVALKLGYTLSGFRLMPYGAALQGEFEGVRPIDEILIALAGPLFNCIVAVIFTALWWLAPATYAFTERLVAVNIFTAIFNLLPVFPLDGGRIALAAMSIKRPRNKAYKRVRVLGFIFAPLFMGLSVLLYFFSGRLNFSFILIGFFIFASTIFPDKNSAYRRIYTVAYFSERLKRGLKVVRIMVPASVTLIELDRMLNSNYYTEFEIVDENMVTVMKITETQLEELLKKRTPLCKISEIIKSP